MGVRAACGEEEGHGYVDDVGEGVADCGHFPVEDADDAGLGLVEDEVVDFVVAVDGLASVFGLRFGVGEEGEHLFPMGQLSDWLFGLNIYSFGLRFSDCCECFDLTTVEASGFAEFLQSDIFWVNTM